MEANHEYRFQNGDRVFIKGQFHHYLTHQPYYLIRNQNGNNYILSQNEFKNLIASERSTNEKIDLYFQYFSGRLDVYAQKWSNGKGYSPALKNWWAFYQTRNDKVAQEKLTKEYAPYTRKVVYDQIISDDCYHHYGIYPLTDNDCTKLLVFDFDKHGAPINPKKATMAVLGTCQKYGISCLPEISSSGDSYHIWLFFCQPIKAWTARQLGKLILVETMMSSDNVDISCFDRMIPAQDSLPKNGFGNLIALPLKWSEVKEKRSIFTDKRLNPLLPTQLFDCLASIKRYTSDEINQLVNRIMKDMQLMKGQNKSFALSNITNYPAEIRGYISGEIYIKRQTLTRREQLSLLGLVTFDNPEFIKKQRMRMPVWNVPSVLTSGRIDGEYICLPRGVLNILKKYCSCHLEKRFASPDKLNATFNGKLREEQLLAVKNLGDHNLGMICAHTGFGKTVVGCALAACRKARTLIIVPTTSIAKQWQKAAFNFLKIKDKPFIEYTEKGHVVRKKKVEIISGSRNRPSRLVDIVNIRKLTRMSPTERRDFYKHYGQIIVDECHHISAVTFESTLVQANVPYIVGLTATPERKDGLEQFMHYRCGPIYYQGNEEANYLIRRYIYPRYTSFAEERTLQIKDNYSQRINHLVINKDRNQLIVDDVQRVVSENRHILLLSGRVNHLKILQKSILELVGKGQVCLVTGGGNSTIDIKDEHLPYVILSTSKYVGEGFDIPSLDTLFLTTPFSWKGNTKQYLGRLERGLNKKDELRVYDYVDLEDNTFIKMYQKRVSVYRKLGYEFVKSKKWNRYDSVYYTSQDYLSVWQHDIDCSSSIFMKVKQLTNQQIVLLTQLMREGRNLHIEVESLPSEYKTNLPLKASKGKVGVNLCIIDNKICWYGNLNLGGRSYVHASGIRIVSRNIAKKVIEESG